MDQSGARSAGEIVLNTLLHPETFHSESRIGKLTKRYDNQIPERKDMLTHIEFQLLASVYQDRLCWCTKT
jgi:hypothetical protein